jgi:hypothetical protein
MAKKTSKRATKACSAAAIRYRAAVAAHVKFEHGSASSRRAWLRRLRAKKAVHRACEGQGT